MCEVSADALVFCRVGRVSADVLVVCRPTCCLYVGDTSVICRPTRWPRRWLDWIGYHYSNPYDLRCCERIVSSNYNLEHALPVFPHVEKLLSVQETRAQIFNRLR